MIDHKDPLWRCPAPGCRVLRYAAVVWVVATFAAVLAGCDGRSWVERSEEMVLTYNSALDPEPPVPYVPVASFDAYGSCILALHGPEHDYVFLKRLGARFMGCGLKDGTEATVDYLVFEDEPEGFHPLAVHWH
jgi:hypothetical protein